MNDFDRVANAYMENIYARGKKIDIQALIMSLEDKSVTDDEQNNLYHIAAKYADYETIKMLAEAQVKPYANEYDQTPLHSLASFYLEPKFYDLMYDAIYNSGKLLLDIKVNPKKKDSNGNTAYWVAADRSMYPFIAAMADSGVKMDAVDDEQKNLLHSICDKFIHRKTIPGIIEPTLKTVKILVDSGSIDLEEKDFFNRTPLYYAQKSGVKELAALLLPEDESAMQTAGMTLSQAVLRKDIEAINTLISENADINEVSDEYGKTALMLACEHPSIEIVNILLKGGANPNFRTGDTECTAIFYLLKAGVYNLRDAKEHPKTILLKIIRSLVESGLQVNDPIDKNGNTALIYTVANNHLSGMMYSFAEEFINAGCNVNLTNNDGQTALMCFAATGNEQDDDIAELLLDSDADCTITDKFSNTALMYAATNGNKISAKKITELIINTDRYTLNNTNNFGESAMDIAVKHGNESVVKVLLNNM